MNEPIPLTDTNGVVRAWACPRCFRVSVGVSCGGPDGREAETQHSYERAKECGLCRRCGAAHPACRWYGIYCDACRKIAEVEGAARYEALRHEIARDLAVRSTQRAVIHDEMLKDLPALAARNWDEEEDLACELMPTVLARLLALQAPADPEAARHRTGLDANRVAPSDGRSRGDVSQLDEVLIAKGTLVQREGIPMALKDDTIVLCRRENLGDF